MRDNYDFSDSKPNPYAKLLKKEIKLRIDEEALSYFKALSAEMGMSYQNLINNYLRDCVQHHRKPTVRWT